MVRVCGICASAADGRRAKTATAKLGSGAVHTSENRAACPHLVAGASGAVEPTHPA